MYTYTPTHRFLVLSAPESAPFHPGNKFLVLSPTEFGPDPRVYDEQPLTDSSSDLSSEMELHRSNSSSSTSSSDSRFNDIAATLPKGFLYLGNSQTRRSSQ
ncbi:uncharacterized protein N7459_007470 [Penicillium hispanicum]|uniref:uncharacterized protein n=1 Tax=Penicillium hispanicum TaxID=1080232 RepID=UPI0025403656|nr:uncharacterized protein N7459_007470 [Penicillium hispanicum]KAJ5578506.1 hypothetical protein N7459_007470 [Penicillium hispanicum]